MATPRKHFFVAIFFFFFFFRPLRLALGLLNRLRVVPYLSSGIVERAKRERAGNSRHARKGDTRGDDFHARSRFARSAIPEEKCKHVSITWYLTSWAINWQWLTVLQKSETKVWLKRLPDQIRASICPRPNFASSFPLHPGPLPDLPINLSVLLFSLSIRWVLKVGPSKNSSVCNQATKSFFFKIFRNIYIYCELQENSSIHFGRFISADFRPNWAQNNIINAKIRAVNNQAD